MIILVRILLINAAILLFLCVFKNLQANILFKASMKTSGNIPMIMSTVTVVFQIFALVLDIYMVLADFIAEKHASLRETVIMFVGAAIAFLSLMYRKSLHEGMEKVAKRSETLKLARNTIMANISHEIRTPMNIIVGLTDIIKRNEEVPQSERDKLNEITEAGASLLGAVNNLIDFVKIESNRLDIIENDYNTKDMICEIIRKTTYMLKDKTVDFISDIDTTVPAVLHGDDVRIIQAVGNILNNACKFTSVGVVTLKVGYTMSNTVAVLNITIEDTGCGISDENKKHVFSSCMSVDSRANRENRGAGLGLLITKSIIEKMSGSISFTSVEGKGTEFTVSIPQRIIDASPIGDVKSEFASSAESKFMFTAPMAKVLVVDDNMVNLFVAKEIMSNYEFEVQTASSGEECLKMAKENFYDIIFMDYVMPGMDGHETLLKLRRPENEHFKRMPVVALTAQIASGSERMYLDEGFQAYLSKPINVSDLEKVLLDLLPEEYICRKESSECSVSETSGKLEDSVWYKRLESVLKDFDVAKGLGYCNNDYTSYINLLRVIFQDGYNQLTGLKDAYGKNDAEGYRITVHAMKSVSASAGAMRLSFIAQEHENAAKSGDFDYIRNHIGALISEYEAFLAEIDTLLQRENEMMQRGMTAHKVNRNENEIMSYVLKLKEALDDFNVDDAEPVLNELENTNLDFNRQRAVSDIKDALELFKYEEAAKILSNEFGI